MAGFLGPDEVRRVKEAIDLVDVMSDYTTLKAAGLNFSGCCAFHQERSPSMHIYTEDQQYHCFGCGVHGDVITLISEKEGLDFMGAVEWLARRAGIELVYAKGSQNTAGDRSKRQQQMDIMEAATCFYEKVLWTSDAAAGARAYLLDRGLTIEVCKAFRLGWAPGKNGFLEHIGITYERSDLIELDVVTEREREGRTLIGDRFWQRLMFPIADRFGQTIAFSARVLPQAEREAAERGVKVGKYINSRETPLFRKGDVVYNLHQARPQARKQKRIIIMEGQVDVIAAHQAGITECVAVLGSAFGSEHAQQIHRSVGQDGRIVLLFDGDNAGQASSIKAVQVCMAAGIPCQVASLPDGKDPAEILQEGSDSLNDVLLKTVLDIDCVLRYLAPRPYELDSRQQLTIIDTLLAIFRKMKDADLRDGFLRDSAMYLNIDSAKLQRRMVATDQQPTIRHSVSAIDSDEIDALPPLSHEQERIFVILLTQAHLRAIAFDRFFCEPHFFPLPWRRIVEALVVNGETTREEILSLEILQADGELRSEIVRFMHQYKDNDMSETDLCEVMQQLQRADGENAIRQLEFRLQEAQRAGQQDVSKALFKELLDMQMHQRSVT